MKKDDWISVAVRLPITNNRYGVKVIVYRKWKHTPEDKRFNHDVTTASFARGKFHHSLADDAYTDKYNESGTHWMPMPNRPKQTT